MQTSVIFSIAFIVFGAVRAQDKSGCDGGTAEGADSVSGAYYYTCTGGVLKPAGCLSDTQQKIPIGQSYNAANIQKTCVLQGDHLTTQCTGCVTDDGKVVKSGENVDGASVYLACVPNADSFDLQVAGCLSGGTRVPVGEKSSVNGQYMVCQKTSNKDASFVVAGCSKDGKNYDIGAEVTDDKAFYHCAKATADATATLKPVGCINGGTKVYDLDLFTVGSSVYRCRVDDAGVRRELFGCEVKLQDGTTEKKSVACTWDVGSDPFHIVKCCIKDKAGGDTATTTDLYCLYTSNGGRIQVDEGCYRVFDNTAAGCTRQADGSLKIDTFDAKNPASAIASGLHQC